MSASDESASTTSPDLFINDPSMNIPDPSILHLEHFNFDQPCPPLAQLFYCAVLGCTPDPGRTALHSTTLWMNLGHTQFHLPLKPHPNRLDGSIGIVIPSQHYTQLPSRLTELLALPIAHSTLISLTPSRTPVTSPQADLLLSQWHLHPSGDGIDHLRVTCPWGNAFEVYPSSSPSPSPSSIGIAYGRIHVPPTAPAGIAHYFSTHFRTPTTLLPSPHPTAAIHTSPTQRLFFEADPSAPSTPPYPSWHYCLYLSDYSGTFQRLVREDLVRAIEDRSDFVTDWKGAKEGAQFRALEMKGEGGEVVWGVEQELRSGKHRHYMRKLLNEPQTRPRDMAADLQVDTQ